MGQKEIMYFAYGSKQSKSRNEMNRNKKIRQKNIEVKIIST